MGREEFIVLGATGMQGRIVSRDLLEKGYHVLLCGRDAGRVNGLLKRYKNSSYQSFDARDMSRTTSMLKESDAKVVINCVEGDWNLNLLTACIVARKHSLDLGSDIPMTKNQMKMHLNLKKKGLTHITGCGSVPGIGNVMLRHAVHAFDSIDTVEVGFNWNSNIKKFVVPFSIQSIIEEFTSPAPVIVNNKMNKINPMDSIIVASHHKIGRQPQFNVGHHPETYTFYRHCKGKGIRTVKFYAGFPRHSFDAITQMIELGYGGKEPIQYTCGDKIKPIEFLTEVLKNLPVPEGYKEKENLWVEIKGKRNRKNKEILMECIVPTLEGWEEAGCNIDTGMPASIMAQMISKGEINERGSFAPEDIVPVKPFFEELSRRQMIVLENGKRIN